MSRSDAAKPKSRDVSLTLYDPHRGEPALTVEDLPARGHPTATRSNYFTVIWIRQGRGTLRVDLGSHAVGPASLLFLAPYQSMRLFADSPMHGAILRFHANFFCIETYHEEV